MSNTNEHLLSLRAKYMEEFLTTDVFLNNLDAFAEYREGSLYQGDNISNEDISHDSNTEIEQIMERREKDKPKRRSAKAIKIINKIQKTYNGEALEQNYNAFKTFSLDATDLAVLDQIERTIDGVGVQELADVEAEMKKANDFLNNLASQLEQAKKDRDLLKINSLKEALNRIRKTEEEIKEAKWYERPTPNAIGDLKLDD